MVTSTGEVAQTISRQSLSTSIDPKLIGAQSKITAAASKDSSKDAPNLTAGISARRFKKLNHVIQQPQDSVELANILLGRSDLGGLGFREKRYVARKVIDTWQQQEHAVNAKNLTSILKYVRKSPSTLKSVVFAIASKEADLQRSLKKYELAYSTDALRLRNKMFCEALKIDPTTVLRAFKGVEDRIGPAAIPTHAPANHKTREKLWQAIAENKGGLSPHQIERLTHSLFVYEKPNFARYPTVSKHIATAIAKSRHPGNTQADIKAREVVNKNIHAVLRSAAGREMLFGEKTLPEDRLAALAHVLNTTQTVDTQKYKDGWASKSISIDLAKGAIEKYRLSRGVVPKRMSGTVLRNMVGTSLGHPPVATVAKLASKKNALSKDVMDKGLNTNHYSKMKNQIVETISKHIECIGGPNPEVMIVPVTVTSKACKPANVPVFRVENPKTGKAEFVCHLGRKYKDFEDWKNNNKLPEGKMTFCKELNLRSQKVSYTNTPGVIDKPAEAFATLGDIAFAGIGIAASVALGLGSFGVIPITAAILSGGWAFGRAGFELGEMQSRGTNITDVTNPDVFPKLLECAASGLTVLGISGGAYVRLAQPSKYIPKLVSTSNLTMIKGIGQGVDVVAAGNEGYRAHKNWDKMKPAEKLAAIMTSAYFLGASASLNKTNKSRVSDNSDPYNFYSIEKRIVTGTAYPTEYDPKLKRSDMRIAYDTNAKGEPINPRIKHGRASDNLDRAQVGVYDFAITLSQKSTELRESFNKIVGRKKPRSGSAGAKAATELKVIEKENKAIMEGLSKPNLTLQQKQSFAERQYKLHKQQVMLEGDLYELKKAKGNRVLGSIAKVKKNSQPTVRLEPEIANEILMSRYTIYGHGSYDLRRAGPHSPEILDHPDYKILHKEVRPDGTLEVRFQRKIKDIQLLSHLKGRSFFPVETTELFPPKWDVKTTKANIEEVARSPAVFHFPTGGSLHRKTVDGVQIDVLVAKKKVIAAYPSLGHPLPRH